VTDVATLKNKAARISVGNEAPTAYVSPMQGGTHSLIRDLFARHQDPAADARLMRHAEESEYRDVYKGSGADGFLNPLWVVEDWATDVARAPRKLANLFQSVPLPPYSQLQVAHVTTGVDVGVSNPENAAVTQVDLASEVKSYDVAEIAGRLGISRLSLDRSSPGLDYSVFAALHKAYDAKLEAQLVSGSGSSGQLLGLLNVGSTIGVTYTQASPDQQTATQNIAFAVSKVATQRQVTDLAVVAHPRRLAWLASASGTASLSDQPAFTDFGLNVSFYASPSIPTTQGASTNQDCIFVIHPGSFYIAESPELKFRGDNAKSSTATAQLIYAGWAAAATDLYPKATAIVTGTGLASNAGF
jgi:hypothetical protein